MAATFETTNQLLAALPGRTRSEVLKTCKPFRLTLGERLSEPGQRIDYVYFPADGFISLLANVDGRTNLEVGLIGNEGMFGTSSLLGVDVAPLRAEVQCSGTALRMHTADLRRALLAYSVLRNTLNRYFYVAVAELAQFAVCASIHRLEARVARWLLMVHDRAGTDRLSVTHGLLAKMLGVRRSGVSVAAAALESRGLIACSRGAITILDRRGLEGATCTCYRAAYQTYRQHLG